MWRTKDLLLVILGWTGMMAVILGAAGYGEYQNYRLRKAREEDAFQLKLQKHNNCHEEHSIDGVHWTIGPAMPCYPQQRVRETK